MMDKSKYREILSSFDSLVTHAARISQKFTELETNGERIEYTNTIFTKLLCHALSLRKISPTLSPEIATELWDISSASAIARALIETYEALAYIGLNDITSIERDFRIKLWELHDQQRRIKMLEQINSNNPELIKLKSNAKLLEEKIIKHTLFLNCSQKVKNKIRDKEAPPVYLTQKELNNESGVNHEYHNTATMALSQYVHTLPMSVHQLMNFKAGEEMSLHICSMPIQYSMPFLAKAISDITREFPNKFALSNSHALSDIEFWTEVAEKGISKY